MTIRAFLAIDLDSPIRESLENFQRQWIPVLPKMSWVKPHSAHLTVKFLGNVEEAQLEPLRHAVEQAVGPSSVFSLLLEGVGVFPNPRMPRIFWAGVSGEIDQLQILVTLVEQAVVPLGFPPEGKPYHAHLTLARVKTHSREVGMALAITGILGQPHVLGSLSVDCISLYKSELKPTGPVYIQLWEVLLGK